AGRYRVRGRGGLEFHGTAAVTLAAGQVVTAAVRPEKLTAVDAPATEWNVGKGAVEEVIYAGDATRYRVGLGADGALTVKAPNGPDAPPYMPGTPLTLAWDPAATRLFPTAAER